MGRAPCCSKVGLNRGPWTLEEDALLSKYIETHGEGSWRNVPKLAGLLRCGKSCRLRWVNYLRPSVKRGNISEDEENLIIKLHSLLGNRWSLIAGRMSGRTDNEIKNYWNTHLSKKLKKLGIDPKTHKPLNVTQKAQSAAAQAKDQDQSSPQNSSLSQLDISRASLSECLEETSQDQSGPTGAPLSFNEMQESKAVIKGVQRSVGNVSENSKINQSSELAPQEMSRPKSPAVITSCSNSNMGRDPSYVTSLDYRASNWNNVLQSISGTNHISSSGDSFKSNWPASPSSVVCADFSRSSNCGSPSTSAILTSTNCVNCKDQFMNSSSESSQLPPLMVTDINHDQSSFSILNFSMESHEIGSPDNSAAAFSKHTISKVNWLTLNDTDTCRSGADKLNANMTSVEDFDGIGFLEIAGDGAGDFSWEFTKKQEATDYSELVNLSLTRTNLWDEFGHIISSSEQESPRISCQSIDPFILSFPNNYELELLQELETSRKHMMISPQITPRQYDETLCFAPCSEYTVDNPVCMTYELY